MRAMSPGLPGNSFVNAVVDGRELSGSLVALFEGGTAKPVVDVGLVDVGRRVGERDPNRTASESAADR